MRGFGYPEFTTGSYKLSKANAINPFDATNADYDTETLDKFTKAIKTIKDKNSSALKMFSQGCGVENDIPSKYLDITMQTIGTNKKVLFIEINSPKNDGVLSVDSLTIEGSVVSLEEVDGDEKGSKKNDLFVAFNTTNVVTDVDYITLGGTKRNVTQENVLFKNCSLLDDSLNPIKKVSLKAKQKAILIVSAELPDNAGTDIRNVLYTMNGIKLKGKFKTDKHTFKIDGAKNFSTPMSFVYAKDVNTFLKSAMYNGPLVRALYATDTFFYAANIPIVKGARSPEYIRSFTELLKAYGIVYYCFDYSQQLTLSFQKDGNYLLYLTFPGFEQILSGSEVNKAINSNVEVKYINNSKIATDKKELKVNKLIIDIGYTYKSNYSVKLSAPDNYSELTNIFLFVENKKLKLSVLSSKEAAIADIDYVSLESGYSLPFSFIPSSNLVQQLTYAQSQGYATAGINMILWFAPFSFMVTGGMIGMWYALFYTTLAICSAVFNQISSEGLQDFNSSSYKPMPYIYGLADSFIGRNSNITSNHSNSIYLKGSAVKGLLSTLSSQVDVVTFFGPLGCSLNEISKPALPHTANFGGHLPEDLFDPDKNIVLTDELKAWAIFKINELFSFNYRSPMAYADDLTASRPAAKAFFKMFNVSEVKGGNLYHPFADIKNKKLVAGLKTDDFFKHNRSEIISKKLNDYLNYLRGNGNSLKATKNEFLLFITEYLQRTIPSLGGVASETWMLTPDSKHPDEKENLIASLSHEELLSSTLIYDHDEGKLTKPNYIIEHSLPTVGGKVKSSKRLNKSGLFEFDDSDLKKVASGKDYNSKTLDVPNNYDFAYLLT